MRRNAIIGVLVLVSLLVGIGYWAYKQGYLQGAEGRGLRDVNGDGLIDWRDCDLNGDGVIDGFDLDILAAHFNTKRGDANFLDSCDFNGDGFIDNDDLDILQHYWS